MDTGETESEAFSEREATLLKTGINGAETLSLSSARVYLPFIERERESHTTR